MESEVVLEVATPAHVDLIAPRVRASDAAEILASGGYTPKDALLAALEVSDFARAGFIAGEPAAMFGVAYERVPWLLTTNVVDRYPLTFWRASKAVLRQMLIAYPELEQQVDARYASAVSWLDRLGFEIGDPAPFGKAQLPFHPVRIGAAHV